MNREFYQDECVVLHWKYASNLLYIYKNDQVLRTCIGSQRLSEKVAALTKVCPHILSLFVLFFFISICVNWWKKPVPESRTKTADPVNLCAQYTRNIANATLLGNVCVYPDPTNMKSWNFNSLIYQVNLDLENMYNVLN